MHGSINNNPLTLRSAAVKLYNVGTWQFTTIRGAVAFVGLINAMLLRGELSAMAAYGIISTVSAVAIGPARAILSAAVQLIATYKADEQQPQRVGGVVNKSWVLGSGLSAVIIPTLLGLAPLLRTMGVSEEIVSQVADYYRWFVPAVLPMLCAMAADQFLAFATGQKYFVLISGLSYTMLYMAVSYPLLPSWGIKALGVGWSVSASAMLVGTRCYYGVQSRQNGELAPYGLFRLPQTLTENLSDYKDILLKGLPIAALTLVDYGCLMGLIILAALMGENELSAASIILQIMFIFYFMLQGLNQATTKLITLHKTDLVSCRRISFVAVILAVLAAVCMSGVNIFPEQVVSLFLEPTSANFTPVLTNVKQMLPWGTTSLTVDAFANILISASRGLGDLNFAPAVNFFIVGLLGLGAAAFLTLVWGASPAVLFFVRLCALVLSLFLLVPRWLMQTSSPESVVNPVVVNAATDNGRRSIFASWFCLLPWSNGRSLDSEQQGLIQGDKPDRQRDCC